MKELFEKCELCNKNGTIKHAGGLFCSEEHAGLYDKKWKDAKERMKEIKTCSVCGKPVSGKSRWTIIDTSVKSISGSFRPYRFCSEKCWEEWGTE